MIKIINNQDTTLFSELKSKINENTELFICASYLTIPALFNLRELLQTAKKIDVIIDNTSLERDIRFAYDSKEAEQYLQLTAKYNAETVRQLLWQKANFRKGNVGGQKFIIVKNHESSTAFQILPYDLNLVALGLLKTGENLFMPMFEDEQNQYLKLFQNAWNNSKTEIKNQIIEWVDKAAKTYNSDFIYKFTVNKIFHDTAFDTVTEQRLNQTGFKSSVIWNMLYDFQRDAVLGAIDKIETHGGCIIADSVGLGKTFEALAVMKYYLLRNCRILVLCPMKLRDNWVVFKENDKRNNLADDRLSYDVLHHTDLSRVTGKTGDINLETINWGNYDLLVIDESHNFRNNSPYKDTITRYQRLMRDVIKKGIKTKVLMLSATPVNTKMNDIKNQIAFITEQNDNALFDFGIESISDTLAIAQGKFNKWLKLKDEDRTRDSLVSKLNGDYFKLLDLLTIARSRKHIEKYYNIDAIGPFPKRIEPPITKYCEFDTERKFPSLDKIDQQLNALKLKFYSPLSYVRDDKIQAYEEKYDTVTERGVTFKQLAREESLIHLMRTNLLKRLESSSHAFKLTLSMLFKQVTDLLEKAEMTQKTGDFEFDLDISEFETDDERFQDLAIGGKVKVLLQDMDLIRFTEELKDDQEKLEKLLDMVSVIDSNRDDKLQTLKAVIEEKIKNPINPGNNKVIIFSAFADTVIYLYDNLSEWLLQKGLYSALVVGGDKNKTNMPDCRKDLNSILSSFSPISKGRAVYNPDEKNEIDIVFCTDCISEGQNLQDCDYLINYDIHWNPVRIIQRFGRIDRIGSKNKKIRLVNFFPNLELDNYINLIGRVKGRMQILDVSATGDENIIEEKAEGKKEDLEYRKKQLEQLQKKVIDLEDIDGGISITDLNFNDFKVDVERIERAERQLLDITPSGIYCLTQTSTDDAPRGVIFCLRELVEKNKESLVNNPIYPYALCYVQEDGDVFVPAQNPKRCLDYFKKFCAGNTDISPKLVAEFNQKTKNGRYMDAYRQLLEKATNDIKGVIAETGLDTLANPGGTTLKTQNQKTSFEFISAVFIK